ncbi:M24 family metallopeptidase [Leptospira weilii]|uniref:M24 family metallopeptidase n=1 Tax=Leptospira weilii TaxID=28184 RepID=UPI00077327A4|nr:M24 family metallopeptidase [Leptospira weilii]
MNNKLNNLIKAQEKAKELFDLIVSKNLIRSGISEKQLTEKIFLLAKNNLSIDKFWHKKIVRTGINTIHPYDAKPENLMIQQNDILWIDFGPIFNSFEADFGRTFVLGNDSEKTKLKDAVEKSWFETRDYYNSKDNVTGKELFEFVDKLAKNYNFFFGNDIAGHLVDEFSHYKIHKSTPENYICLENNTNLKDKFEKKERYRILEMHFLSNEKNFGSFFEQLLI